MSIKKMADASSKNSRILLVQKERLVNCVWNDRRLHTRALNCPNAHSEFKKLWGNVNRYMNDLYGGNRDWQKTWADMEYRVRKKQTELIDNPSTPMLPFSPLDKRIASIITSSSLTSLNQSQGDLPASLTDADLTDSPNMLHDINGSYPIEPENLAQMDKTQQIPYLVRQYPCLYDRNLYEYKNSVKREEAWTEIANRLGFPSGGEVSKLFAHMRGKYVQYSKKDHSTQDLEQNHFLASMSFLDPHIPQRNRDSIRGNDGNSTSTSLVFNITANGTKSHQSAYLDFLSGTDSREDEYDSSSLIPEVQMLEDGSESLQSTSSGQLINPPIISSPGSTRLRETPRWNKTEKEDDEREAVIINTVTRILKSQRKRTADELYAEFIEQRILDISQGLTKRQHVKLRTKLTQVLDIIEGSFS